MKPKARSSTKKKVIISLIAVLVLVALAGGGYALRQKQIDSKETAKTTSKEPTAQEDYTTGKDRPTSTGNSNNQGGAVDTKGKPTEPVPDDESTWTKSASGEITLKQPTNGTSLASGAQIAGSSNLAAVQYRLVDDQVGVIAQGTLNTTDGNFSGNLQFTARGTSGKLVVFNYDRVTGAEQNSISIPLTFSR